MEFHFLGSLEVWEGGRRLAPLRPRQERFLARLLLSPNTTVTVGALAEALWDTEPPASAERQVFNTASQLRQAWLRGGVEEAREWVRTERSGYRLELGIERIDLYRFRAMVAQAEELKACGELAAAAATLRRSLALWRGPAFAGVTGLVLAGHAASINDEKPAAWEACMRLELSLGLHDRVVATLAPLLAEFPFREQLTSFLMTALYRAGRQKDALDAYHTVRARLNDELGIDPGPELAGLYQRILQRDPRLAAPTSGPATRPQVANAPRYPPAPSQIPPAVGHFTGRHAELERLSGGIGQGAVIAVTGPAGMGKTSLVVQWAHAVRQAFPDGQIFLDLQGERPLSGRAQSTILTHVLEALNVPGRHIPGSLDKQVALYRSLVSDKRLLIILDNAHEADDVLPVVPVGAGSQLVVTSRIHLGGLYTRVAVHAVEVAAMTPSESQELLVGVAGAAVMSEAAALERVIDLCGGMPLALRILAARIRLEADLTLRDLAAQLAREDDALDQFVLEGDGRNVRSVLTGAYASLSQDDARLFRLLAVHPGRRLRVELVAVLAGLPPATVEQNLRNLVAVHLVDEVGERYFAMHDLVRSFARERLLSRASDDRLDAARGRLLRWYVSATANANSVLRPDRSAYKGDEQVAGSHLAPLGDPQAAVEFLHAERDNLAPVTSCAVAHDVELAVNLIYNLHSYFVRTGFPDADVEAWKACGAKADGITDVRVRAHLHHALGAALGMSHNADGALVHLRRSADLYELDGDPAGAAGSRLGIGWVLDNQGEYSDALVEHESALALARAAGNPTLTVHALNNCADALIALGSLDSGLERLVTGRALAREAGLKHHEAAILSSIGALFIRKKQPLSALHHLRESLALMRASSFRTAEADTLRRLGQAELICGNRAEATRCFREALGLYRQSNDTAGEAAVLSLIGESQAYA